MANEDYYGAMNRADIDNLKLKVATLEQAISTRIGRIEHELRPYAPMTIETDIKKVGILGFQMGDGAGSSFKANSSSPGRLATANS